MRISGEWEPAASLFSALEPILETHWDHPVLRKILDGEVDDETEGIDNLTAVKTRF